jgi:hypothetical protein
MNMMVPFIGTSSAVLSHLSDRTSDEKGSKNN